MSSPEVSLATAQDIDKFVTRWQGAGGTERANYQLFLTELCTLLALPQPQPASEDSSTNAYVFERRVDIQNPDGSTNRGFIDLYKAGCFVLEAKQTGMTLDTQGWDKAMLRAQNQADQYVRALPTSEGRPPFIVVTDVGRSLELYAEFSRSGGTYVPFPDPGHHRIRLEDLHNPEIQERLRLLWLQPEKLDPSKIAARVTRAISAKLAELARSLEAQGNDVQRVAHFLKRCLFTLFSEDVGLLPEHGFLHLLESQLERPENFPFALKALWDSMNTGGYSPVLNQTVRQFNGGLFQDNDAIALDAQQIRLLIEAARTDWRHVEPAIFGTLLERALDPRERHKLGAHFTPRAYVERLVMPTLIDPLREQWRTVQIAAEAWLQQGKQDKALAELRQLHHQLCQTKVLDPACGSGNFLYVALEHMKRLEGEVLNVIRDLSAGQASFETEGLTVDPHQFLGLEINPRAAAIAEIVLWIGYLQWHYRIHGKLDIPDPVLRDFHNIENRDALLEYDSREVVCDDDGNPVTIWDGISFKESPTTGEMIPDDSCRVSVYRYINPRRAEWPAADFIVGNPPFIGAKRMRDLLGDGYVDALQQVWSDVPQSTDFVMRWWHHAAVTVKNGKARRFGFITTNSIRQTYIRRAVEPHLSGERPIKLLFAIPDHPWVDSNSGAAVRIAMTVGGADESKSRLLTVTSECNVTDKEDLVSTISIREGFIGADLTIGADVASARLLRSNRGICSVGMKTIGSSFQVTASKARELGLGVTQDTEKHIRPYFNGRDFTSTPRGVYVVDFFGVELNELRTKFPDVYQYLLHYAKPERDKNRNKLFRENWWVIGHPRQEFRRFTQGLEKYVITVETMKHRLFGLAETNVTPDSTLVTFGTENLGHFGILSSRVHGAWALAAGGTLEDRPRYNKTRCFETFPFPDTTDGQALTIGQLAEQLDIHRKRQQAVHPDLTLTGMYNVLEKLRSGEPLSAKDKVIHEQGLVSVLKELHDDLDRAVFDAYGWNDLADKLVGRPGATTPLPDKPAEQAEAEEELLIRLVALNALRAAEEAQGHVRWLRPDYQAPMASQTIVELSLDTEQKAAVATPQAKQSWPQTMPEQVAIVRTALAAGPHTLEALANQFKRKPMKGVEQVLAALQVLGHAQCHENQWRLS